ncbi:MAG: nitrate reductase associated protein, partial [Synechocystis sp.]|nr:nitrate reductase associated protein [Synechocystis sp.]
FEQDFVDSLRCIPMVVRFKLDTCGVKLKLNHWHQLSNGDRQTLVTLPCQSPAEIDAYRAHLQTLVTAMQGKPASELAIDPHPPWLENERIPAPVLEKAASLDATITQNQWQSLTPLQRFALIKLSRPGHENRNFLPALQEFGLNIP